MNLINQFILAAKSYIKAISLIINNRLWIYFIYPFVLFILLFFIGNTLIRQLSNSIEHFFTGFYYLHNNPNKLIILKGFLHYCLSIGLKIMFFLIYSAISKYVVLILMSPVMAILSQRTEKILTGNETKISKAHFIKNLIRSILIILRNMFLQLLIVFLSCILIWIPIAGWLCPLVLLIFSYYFYGFSMMDYVLERHKLNASKTVKYIRKNKGIAIGNGFIFTLLFNIPFMGVILASVISPVAACIAVVNAEKNN